MARELSPFSARRLLTQQLAQGGTGTPQPSHSASGSPARASTHAPERPRSARPERPTRPSRSRSRDKRRRSRTGERKVKESIEEGAVVRKREPSPEPYRKPRASSRDRRHESSRDRKKNRSRDRRRDHSRDGRRDRSREKRRDRSRDKRRDRSKEEDVDGKRRDRSRERHSRRNRSRSRDRRRKDTSTEGRSRSSIPYRSRKPRDRGLSTSASPPPKRRRRTQSQSYSRSPSPHKRSKKPLPDQDVSFRGLDNSAQPPSKYGGAPPDKEKPNFKTTGALAKAANRVEGTKISLKYNEPPEARKPPSSQPWRIFVFKGEDVVDTVELWQKSCWLLGRAHEVVDYLLEHPSSSGQHAVIQFRYIQKTVEDEFGVKSKRGKVKPYIIDLESSNGTELNGEAVEASRYFELRDKDILKFAGSEREYVVMLPPPPEG